MSEVETPPAAPPRTKEQADALLEIQRRAQEEKGRYYEPNGALERVLIYLDEHLDPADARTHIVLIRAGNSAGKTSFAVNIANYVSDAISNPYFDKVRYFERFKANANRNGRPVVGRIATTANAAKKTYEPECAKWFSRGKYKATQDGRHFLTAYEFARTKSGFDIFTFDQKSDAAESITLDWAIVDEPMSHRHWSGLKSRFRFGGIIFLILTPLEGSGWYHDELEVEHRIGKDVHVFEISSLENTIEYGIRGVIPYASLESQWEDFDEAELPARRDGKYLHLSGVIYGGYRQDYLDQAGKVIGHEPERFLPYYRQMWREKNFTLRCVIDPHDRKPFAVGWFATFPNEDTFAVAEWPDETMRPFHKIKQWHWGAEDYAKMIQATEKILGKAADQRWIDPNFGPSPKFNSRESVMATLSRAGREMNYPLRFGLPIDDVKQGHIRVKGLLGNPMHGVRPKIFTMKHCKNFRFGWTHYGWKENKDESKGIGETPELVHKDFMDLVRYAAMGGSGLTYLKRESKRDDLFQPTAGRGGYRGA